MKQIRTRLTYANVMSTIAVFLVLGGATAVAVSKKNSVGAGQLKKGAVTAAKIKNGAVTQDKIAAAAQAALKGNQGPVGLQGPAGPRGPSDGRSSSVKGNVEIGKSEEGAKVIDSLDLGGGKWVLLAEASLGNVSGAERSAWCSLNSGAAELGRTRVWDHEAGLTSLTGDATVLGGVDLPTGGTVQLRCWASGGLVFTFDSSEPAMQAIKVETLVSD